MPALTCTPTVVSHMDDDGVWRTLDGIANRSIDYGPTRIDNRLFFVSQEFMEDSSVPVSAIYEALMSGCVGKAQGLILDQLLAEENEQIARDNQAAMDAFWAARPGQPE